MLPDSWCVTFSSSKPLFGWLEAVQPFAKHLARGTFERRAVTDGIGAQGCHGRPAFRHFARIRNKPGFKTVDQDFRMALQAQDVIAPTESLVLAKIGGCKSRGAIGKIEGIAMPMENRRRLTICFEMPQSRSPSRVGQRQRLPAEFFLRRRINLRAQRTRNQ